ncbi:hypothetical protein SY83_14610 [Paenibacillus swuensis]|uniref:Hydrolase n=1 Tax=Paenibacillus swuensis TaxID=1178515 RepID=A0A172TKJ9_9BACL|nr:HAD family hydrolase [Paenibacillus swuensis]ANE47293.1 hypothetical protein SY83_14610 [Paenibacillus swuensis]
MIKMIVSDLDGTLLTHEGSIHPQDAEAVARAHRDGYEICFASGRMYGELGTVMDRFGLRFHAVGQNGATVHRLDRLLGSSKFPSALASELYTLAETLDLVHFVHCNNDAYYFPERNERTIPIEKRLLIPGTELRDLRGALSRAEIEPCKITFLGELTALRRLQAQLNVKFPGKIETYIADVDCLDVMPLGISKGAGLTMLAKELGLRNDEIACIGDSFNDISMFEFTPHSYAMQGAAEGVRQAANFVVPSVADAIARVYRYNAMEEKIG